MVGKRVAQAQTVVALPRPTRHSRKAEEDFLRAAGLSSGSLAEDNWLRSSTGRRQRAGREAESEREGERSEHETAEPFPGEEEDDDHDFPPPEASQSTSAPVAPSAKAEVEAEASTGGGTSKVVSPKARKAFSSARENGHEHAKSDAGRVTSWVNDVGEHSRAQSVRGSPSLLPPPVSSPALDELGGQGPSMEHTLSNGKSATPSATHGAQHPQAERKSPPLFPAPVNSPAVEDTNGQRRPTSDAQSSNHGLTNSGRVKRTEREDYSLILDRDSDADVEGTSSYTKKGKGKTKAKQLDGRIGAEQGSTPQRPKQRRSNSLTPVSIQRQQKTQRKKYGRIPDSESGSDLDSDCVADVVGPKVKRSHSESGTVPDDRSTPKRRRRKTSAAAQSPQEDGSNVQRRKSVQSQRKLSCLNERGDRAEPDLNHLPLCRS